MHKLCTKCPHQEIRWNYGILRSANWLFFSVNLNRLLKKIKYEPDMLLQKIPSKINFIQILIIQKMKFSIQDSLMYLKSLLVTVDFFSKLLKTSFEGLSLLSVSTIVWQSKRQSGKKTKTKEIRSISKHLLLDAL